MAKIVVTTHYAETGETITEEIEIDEPNETSPDDLQPAGA